MLNETQRLLELAKSRVMTAAEREDQRINFAFGNASDGDSSTKDTVRAASQIMSETAKKP